MTPNWYDDCEDTEDWMYDWSNDRMTDCPDPDEEPYEDDEGESDWFDKF